MTFIRIFRSCNFAGSVFALRIKRTCPTKLVISKFHKKVMYNMKTAYFHHNEGDDKVYVTVNLSELNRNKTIRFERNILETMTDFLQRVDVRILKLYRKLFMKNESECTPEVKSLLLFNNEPFFDRVIFRDIFENNDFDGNLKLRILESDYDIIINCPLITNMDLPKVFFVGCYVQPENIKAQYVDCQLSDYTWYKSTRPQSQHGWEKCGEGYFYKIKEDDIKTYLKLSCTPKMNGKVGPDFEVMGDVPVSECSNFSAISDRQEFTKEKTGPNEFRIVTYNILADFYLSTKEAKNSIFTFCDPSCVDPGYRETLLNFELEGYNADIMCLQEVEKKLFFKNKVLFSNWGYECSYSGKEGIKEGSAILFKKDKFNLIQSQQYAFTKELLNNPLFNDIKLKIEDNEKLIQRLQYVASQIQVTVLDCVSDNILVIGNVHLYFHPDACHIRLLQGIESIRILLNTVEEVKKMKPNKKVSVMLCGDFNSTPDRGFHKLLTTGSVDDSEPCWTSNVDEAVKGVSCSQPLKMKSCYDDKILTNYIPKFKACIDYIYFQTDHLELKQTVPTPSEEALSQFSGIPSFYFPSDHVALIADLKFKNSD